MKKVKLTDEQIQAAQQNGNMISFDMTLTPDKLKLQIEGFLRDHLVDEKAIPEMADDMMSQFYNAMAIENGKVN